MKLGGRRGVREFTGEREREIESVCDHIPFYMYVKFLIK